MTLGQMSVSGFGAATCVGEGAGDGDGFGAGAGDEAGGAAGGAGGAGDGFGAGAEQASPLTTKAATTNKTRKPQSFMSTLLSKFCFASRIPESVV